MAQPPILIAVETNDMGQHVWQVGARVAEVLEQPVHVVNVVQPAVSVYADLNFAPLMEYSNEWQRALVKDNKSYIRHMSSKLNCDNVSVKEGQPKLEICATAERVGAQTIVMGVHNRRGFQRLLGSTTHGILNNCQCNVLAVHPDSTAEPYKKVLIAVDGASLTSTVLRRVKAIAPNAEHQLFSVLIPVATAFAATSGITQPAWSLTDLAKDIERETRAGIREAAIEADWIGADEQLELELIVGEPSEEIVARATEWGADLIIMGSENKNAWSRALLGSTARSVLNQTPCDVLVCREQDA